MATTERTFTTPGGRLARMLCREGTNDAMSAEACIEQDEYRTAEVDAGFVLDIGGHIGSWTVGYLLDHPHAGGVIIEPLPENAALIAQNLALNGLSSRVVLVIGALSNEALPEIKWDFGGSEVASMHRYVAGARIAEGITHSTMTTAGYTLADLVEMSEAGAFGLVKIDCEGGEQALIGADLSPLGLIVGEVHVPHRPLVEWMSRTHDVTYEGEDTFGMMRATPRWT